MTNVQIQPHLTFLPIPSRLTECRLRLLNREVNTRVNRESSVTPTRNARHGCEYLLRFMILAWDRPVVKIWLQDTRFEVGLPSDPYVGGQMPCYLSSPDLLRPTEGSPVLVDGVSAQRWLPSCRDACHLVRFPFLLGPSVDRLDLVVMPRRRERCFVQPLPHLRAPAPADP